MKIVVIFACHNRKNLTEKSIKSLVTRNQAVDFTIVAVDDNSTDGTREMLGSLSKEFNIHILEGTGDLYYSGGMRKGMEYVLAKLSDKYDYVLMTNDDVEFKDSCITKMISQSREQNDAIIAGGICSSDRQLTYGAIKYVKGTKYKTYGIEDWDKDADTFNGNCVLIPFAAFESAGVIDQKYRHTLGDFDYGLVLKRKGYKIHGSKEIAGYCESNSAEKTWLDTSLSRTERIKMKESVKGAPARQWFYFLRKNFGLSAALKGSITPYIRILIGK